MFGQAGHRWIARTLGAVLLAGCGNDIAVTKQSVCDGVRQQGEETVDRPFDADGDGAFDAANPGCAATYAPQFLDCDDADAEIRPGSIEVTCNGVDDDCSADTPDALDADEDGHDACVDCDDASNLAFPGGEEVCGNAADDDCDGTADEECDSDYSGTWALDRDISYSCGWGSVSINFDRVLILDEAPAITVDALGSGAQPGQMVGGFESDTTFSADQTLYGTCNETYLFEGTFTSDTTFEGTFSATYTGSLCVDCANQSWTVTGSR